MSRVWVLGTAAWDTVFRIHALPAPGGQAVVEELGRRPGGSTGNIARALSSAGHEVFLVCRVGDDDAGSRLVDELRSWGIDTRHIQPRDDCTAEAMILIDDNCDRTIFVVANDECFRGTHVPYAEVSSADCVYVGTYDDFGPELPSVLSASGALVATSVPPRSATDWLAHIVLGSAGEYRGHGLSTLFADVLRRTGPELRWAVVTLGADGAEARGPRAGDAIHVPGTDVEVVDATGAGDAFAAGFLHGVITGHDATAAARLGCAWGAAAARLSQSVPPRWNELGLGDPSGDWASKLP